MSPEGARKKVRVLVVEDSAVLRELLAHVLGADPAIDVIGFAHDGEEAVEAVKRSKPDVVAMDFHMPKMNGLDATRKIMETDPTPIVIVSGSSAREEVVSAFRLLDAGALAVVEKPRGPGRPDHEAAAAELVQTVKLMSEVKVVRRWLRREAAVPAAPAHRSAGAEVPARQARLVAIGASTGGPIVLKTILAALPGDFAVPILVVQHIATGFTDGLVEWLGQSSGVAVHTAADGEYLLPGHAYVAPDDFHMKLRQEDRVALTREAPENGHRPSVSVLFRSVATVLGREAIGVLLTGMGTDGAGELRLMREKGAVTIAQDHDSSVVHGMPGEAINLQAAAYVLSPAGIAAALARLVK